MPETDQNDCPTQLNMLVAAAHELKTPLTIIAHLASVLEDEPYPLTPIERQASLQRIQLSAQRTLRLVQDLTVSYNVAQRNQLELELEPVNATQVCEEVAHEILPFAAQSQQTIQLGLGTRSQLVVANRDMLYMIFFNLIDNAIRHNPAETCVKVTMQRRQQLVRAIVQDNGPGLHKRDFAQLKHTLGTQIQPMRGRSTSSGLGLYIVGQVAAAMGGHVGVGRSNQGANFHVDLLRSHQLMLW